jgi:SsrA-binding protein
MAVKMITTNKAVRLNFEILESIECGIALRGAEVKALRDTNVTIKEAFARFEDSELWLVGLHITPYARASTHVKADPTRKRKLLLHRYELDRLKARTDQDRLSLVPMALYFKEGRAKLELGIGRGRRTVDKRQLIAKRDADREARRELATRNR